MNLSNLDKRLAALEANQPEELTWEKFCEVLEQDIVCVRKVYGRIKDRDLDENNASLVEICASRIDWSSVWDPARVILGVKKLRKSCPEAGYDLFKAKLIEWLDNRGTSTIENLTTGPGVTA